MKTLSTLLILFFLAACSTDDNTNRQAAQLNIPEEFWGDFTGQDYGLRLHVTEHSILMETPETLLDITQAVQMAYSDEYGYDNFGLADDTYLQFRLFSNVGMWATYSNSQQTLFTDFYVRD